MRYTRIHTIVIAGAALWCSLIMVAPIYNLNFVYVFFKQICHQLPDRSWWLAGSPLPVCSRCTSIYLGFLVGAATPFRPDLRFLLASLTITLVEFFIARFFLDSVWLRSGSGFVLGGAVGPFVVMGVKEMMARKAWQNMKVARGSV